jgi:GcrA cell cycle regulator
MMAFEWTAGRLRILHNRIAAGVPASAIAVELGTTKGTICGKAHRLGLRSVKTNAKDPGHGIEHPWRNGKQPSKAAPPPKPARVRKRATKPKNQEEPVVPVIAAARARIAAPPPLKKKGPRPICELGLNECRWPIGELLAPPGLFCGEPTAGGATYCPEHYPRSVGRS